MQKPLSTPGTVLKCSVHYLCFIWHYLALNGTVLAALLSDVMWVSHHMSDGWHYQTSSNLINKCPHTGINEVRFLREFLKRKSKSNPTGGGRFWMFLTSSNTHIVFYPSRGPLQAFLLASACLFCWMLRNTDISLKYWIHPSLGCELSLLLKEEKREGKKGEERWDPWINCHQFISFTGQSEACNAGWNWILVVVKHHKSKQRCTS